MSHFGSVIRSYKVAWSLRNFIFIVYLGLQVAAFALITPIAGAVINLAVSFSDQSALTDQDIALFLLSPVGLVVGVGTASVLLLAEVFGFTFMAAVLRQNVRGLAGARMAIGLVMFRLRALLVFSVLFVARVLALALPFLLGALLVAMWYLTEFDINYYLTFKPPEFKWAVALIVVIVLAMALALLVRLSQWAMALHLVLFGNVKPTKAFSGSAELMQGQTTRLRVEIVIWILIRVALAVGAGALAGVVLNMIPLHVGSGLKLALFATAMVGLGWMVSGLVISAISLGALAALLDGFYDGPGTEPPLEAVPQAGSLRKTLILTAVGVGGLAIAGFWTGGAFLDDIRTEDRVEIIGHRGAAGLRPENTMASIEKAIEDGADWVEIDVQETADGEVVVMHDSDFMKLAHVNLKIWDATMADIESIDIGSWYDPAYSDQRAPLLRDALAAVGGTPSRLLIELKYYGHDVDLENRVIALVEDMEMEDRVAFMSLKYPAVLKMHELRPNWRVGVLAATAVGNLAGLQADFIAVNTAMANARVINSVESAGKDLYVWTVNDPLEMSRMISRGVNGLITDEPALARQVLAARAELSTPERLILWISQILGLEMNTKDYRDESP